jgi:hypothetical protein
VTGYHSAPHCSASRTVAALAFVALVFAIGMVLLWSEAAAPPFVLRAGAGIGGVPPTVGLLLLAILLFGNLIVALVRGEKAGQNPWGGVTLEWKIPTPPPPENFEVVPTITSRPYVFNPEVSK